MSTRPWKKIQLKNIFLLLPFKPLTSIPECRSYWWMRDIVVKMQLGKNFMGRSSGAKKLIIFITLRGSLSSNIHTIISHTASWQSNISSMNEINLCVNIWRISSDPFSKESQHWNNFKVNVVCIIFHSDFFLSF